METFIYILKAAAILSIFYLVYILVLRKDTFFSANRYYLIGGIIASILLPFVVFTKTVYLNTPLTKGLMHNTNGIIINPEAVSSSTSIDWIYIFSTLYLIGIFIMSIRFIKQLASLYLLITNHSSKKINGFKFIKVKENITPFSFFKYIGNRFKNDFKT